MEAYKRLADEGELGKEARMLEEKLFDTGVVQINYAEGPASGPALVLLHGGGDRWQDFLPILPTLVLRWQVYALDLRGHGKSGRAGGAYRPEDYVADVVSFVKRQLGEQVILFGHSLGGWIALLAAVELAGKARALVLGDPPMNLVRFLEIEGSEERVEMWRKMGALAGSGLSVADLASAMSGSPSSGEALDWAKKLSLVDPDVAQYHGEGRLDEYVSKIDLDGALKRVRCPVLILQGDPPAGGVLSDRDVEQALGLLENGVFVRLQGKGHDLGLSNWEVAPLLRALSGFLESL